MNKQELIKHLNEYLKIDSIDDSSKNGLQVDNTKTEIKKIGFAVDATSYIFDKAIKEKVDFVLVHHGMYWGAESVVTEMHYNRLSKLINNDIGLLAYHLPLDKHEEVGNNMGIIKSFVNLLDIKKYDLKPFSSVGYGIKFTKKLDISLVKQFFVENMGFESHLHNFGKLEKISSIAVCSGGAGFAVQDAKNEGYDLYICGEAKHSDYIRAKEYGASMLVGGHRETETIGVTLLADYISEKFGIETVFLNEKY